MATVTVSPKYQVVIPKSIRDQMAIKVGQRFQLIPFGDRIEFIPIRDIKKMKGFLKGMDSEVDRDEDRL